MGKFNFEEYRQPWETGPHWELKREFLERYQDVFPEDRLLCLAQAYSNIELLHCTYPTPVMLQIHELSKSLKGCKGFRENRRSAVQSNESSPQGQKGKRRIGDSEPEKKFKFIKICSDDEKLQKSNAQSDEESGPVADSQSSADNKVKNYGQPIKNSFEKTVQPQSFTLNKKLLDNSFKQQLVLYDRTEVTGPSQSTHGAVLNYTATQCRKSYTYSMEVNEDGSFKADVLFDKTIIGSGVGSTKGEAKGAATKSAIENLRKEVYTIKVKKVEEEGCIIYRSQMLEVASEISNAVSDDNVGSKMLKMMGWSGGGIGKTGGITEPIIVKSNSFGAGLGYGGTKGKIDLSKFSYQVENLLRDFSRSDKTTSLIFAAEFLKSERKEIHRIANKFDLRNVSHGRNESRELCITRKITVTELLNSLLKSGGCTDKYELVDMSA